MQVFNPFISENDFCFYCSSLAVYIILVPLYLPFSAQQCFLFLFLNVFPQGSKISKCWCQSLKYHFVGNLMGSFEMKSQILQLRKLLLLENFLTSVFWFSFQSYSVSCWVLDLLFFSHFLLLLYYTGDLLLDLQCSARPPPSLFLNFELSLLLLGMPFWCLKDTVSC